jgi:hypothetical protein
MCTLRFMCLLGFLSLLPDDQVEAVRLMSRGPSGQLLALELESGILGLGIINGYG